MPYWSVGKEVVADSRARRARELLAADDVGGALVGGASLTAESFLGIVVGAAELQDARASSSGG